MPKSTPSPAHLVDVEPLVPYEHNSRTHSEDQIAQIMASIRAFGFVGVIGYDERGLAIGHGRREAALRMWAAGEVIMGPGKREALPEGKLPAIDLSGLTEDERRALIIADNKLALNAGWDEDILAAEIEALRTAEFDIPVLGFDPAELEQLFNRGNEGRTDPDDIPPVPENPVARAGDVWLLGNHRLGCGDATKAADVQSVLVDIEPNLMATDPPYGVNYDANWRNLTNDIGRSARAIGKVSNDDRADWSEAWRHFPGDVAYVWHAGNKAHIVAESLISCGFEIRAQIIWAKQQLVIGRGDYHPKHEPCWYAVRKGKPGRYVGGRKQTTLWEIDKPHKSETGHSTQKPVECMRRPIENNSEPGDAVYEPFCGSGTTIIAGEQTGRRILALEINPPYVDVAIRRWQAFTGLEAVLEATGQTFADVERERLGSSDLAAEPALAGAGDEVASAPDGLAPIKTGRKRGGAAALVGG